MVVKGDGRKPVPFLFVCPGMGFAIIKIDANL